MTTIQPPTQNELPSRARLKRSAIVAVVVAAFLVVAVVLPAEVGVDVTGLGRIIGLTEMGKTKVEFAKEFAEAARTREVARLADSADAAESTAMVLDSSSAGRSAMPATLANERSDITVVVLPPAGWAHVMLTMKKGGRVRYSWSLSHVVVDYVVKGDSAVSLPGYDHTYSTGLGRSAKVGLLLAVFDGQHGWSWRNSADTAVRLTLHTSGAYSDLAGVK
jgi:hypothetical protein